MDEVAQNEDQRMQQHRRMKLQRTHPQAESSVSGDSRCIDIPHLRYEVRCACLDTVSNIMIGE